MAGTASGRNGQSVAQSAVRGYRRDFVRVPIHPRLTVAETAVNWDRAWKNGRVKRNVWEPRTVR